MFIVLVLVFLLLIILGTIIYFEIPRYYSHSNKTSKDLSYLDKQYNKKPRVNIDGKVVVSLTTIPSRIDQIVPTLCSILSQTHRVDKIRLNLPYRSLKGDKYKIPDYLLELENINIVRVEKDLGPSTKLLPTSLDEDPDTKIIVIDDDMIYGSRLVETLVEAYKKKKCAITNYGSDSHVCSSTRVYDYVKGGKYVTSLFGCGGYLVTPSMLPKEIYDYSSAPEGAKYVDDDWISGWLNVNQVKIYLVGMKHGCGFFPTIRSLNTPSLCNSVNKDNNYEKDVDNWFREMGYYRK